MAGKSESLYYYREESQYYGNNGNPAPKMPQNNTDSQYYGDENSRYYDENSQYYDENSQYYDRDSQYYRDGDDSRYYDDKNNDTRYDDSYYDENSQYYDEKDSRYYDNPPRRDTDNKGYTNSSQPRDSVSEFNAYYDDDDYDNPPRGASQDPPRGASQQQGGRDSRYDDSRYDDSRYDDSRYDDSRYDDNYRDSRYDDSRYDDSRYDDNYRDSRYDDSRYDDSRYDDNYRDSRYDDSRYDDSRYDDTYRDSRYDDSRYNDQNNAPPNTSPQKYNNDRDAAPSNPDNLNKMMNNLKIDPQEEENICFSCKNPIKGKAHPKNGHVYCAKDYVMLFAPKCKKCQKPIKGETVCALGAKYHKACFSCITCNKPFPDKSFYVFNNNPVCRRHYHQLNNSLCTKCDDPIEGPCAEVIEGRFHPNCFVCCICFTPLTGLYYNFQGEAYCEADIMKIHKEKINKANKRRTIMSFIE